MACETEQARPPFLRVRNRWIDRHAAVGASGNGKDGGDHGVAHVVGIVASGALPSARGDLPLPGDRCKHRSAVPCPVSVDRYRPPHHMGVLVTMVYIRGSP